MKRLLHAIAILALFCLVSSTQAGHTLLFSSSPTETGYLCLKGQTITVDAANYAVCVFLGFQGDIGQPFTIPNMDDVVVYGTDGTIPGKAPGMIRGSNFLSPKSFPYTTDAANTVDPIYPRSPKWGYRSGTTLVQQEQVEIRNLRMYVLIKISP